MAAPECLSVKKRETVVMAAWWCTLGFIDANDFNAHLFPSRRVEEMMFVFDNQFIQTITTTVMHDNNVEKKIPPDGFTSSDNQRRPRLKR